MAEWLYEAGIGENRAVLIEGGEIVEATIERLGDLRPGAVVAARLTRILVPGRRGILTLVSGGEALLEPVPPGLTEGAALRAEILRAALPESGRAKLAKARVTEAGESEGASLREVIERSGHPIVECGPTGADAFEQAGWSELLEEARTGSIAFPGGSLRMSLTPAMTLFDVDGALPPLELAIAGAGAAARAIRRLALGGSIGIDLPTLPAKADRQAAAAALNDVLPQPFERSAVNGFGFLQVVRRRERASIPELVQYDAGGAAARALLRKAERTGGIGPRTIRAAPAVAAQIEAQSGWLAELSRRIGASAVLQADPALPIWSGHVQSQFA